MVRRSYEVLNFSSSISAARNYKARVLELYDLMSKVFPQANTSCQVLSGDGGVGTIRLVTGPQGISKERIDEIDKEKRTCTFSVIEGNPLEFVIEAMSVHLEVVPTPRGGSIFKSTLTYNLKGTQKKADMYLNAIKEGGIPINDAIEAYLRANPNEFN